MSDCKVLFFSLEKPQEAMAEPEFVDLLDQGYRPMANFVADRGHGAEMVFFLTKDHSNNSTLIISAFIILSAVSICTTLVALL